ncbi:hypothetical protein ES703_09975 [subsurface metagenome]
MRRKVFLAKEIRRVNIAAKDKEEALRYAEEYFIRDKIMGAIEVEEVCTFFDSEIEEVKE